MRLYGLHGNLLWAVRQDDLATADALIKAGASGQLWRQHRETRLSEIQIACE